MSVRAVAVPLGTLAGVMGEGSATFGAHTALCCRVLVALRQCRRHECARIHVLCSENDVVVSGVTKGRGKGKRKFDKTRDGCVGTPFVLFRIYFLVDTGIGVLPRS